MIFVRLMGGLGNQMFQYSLGRRLAMTHGVPLKFDLTFFATQQERLVDTPREFALRGWRIDGSEATAAELSQFRAERHGRVARLLSILAPKASGRVVQERGFQFDKAVLGVRLPALLVGYWQSEKYFDAIKKTLQQDFTLSIAPCEHVGSLMHTIADPNAVSLHVRRGDYVRNEITNTYHGVCSLEYYQAACNFIAQHVDDPHFIVFSDEPQWAIDHLRLPWPTTVVQHGPACQPHQDMWLMSRCSHHVIANSSFSWWGAWLGQNAHKLVVAPKSWFRGVNQSTADLIPERWIRL